MVKKPSETIVIKDISATIETPAIQEEIVENIEADETIKETPITEEIQQEIGMHGCW